MRLGAWGQAARDEDRDRVAEGASWERRGSVEGASRERRGSVVGASWERRGSVVGRGVSGTRQSLTNQSLPKAGTLEHFVFHPRA
jgi:hypothetical protein